MTRSLVGAELGKYQILAEIGHGGMSVVYRARDTSLERDVAIKVMHAFLAEQAEAKERFHREAVAVARLKHPHIVEVYDYSGVDAATSYIVMELVQGTSLAEFLRVTPLPQPESALILASPIAAALAHAHERGIIHRDLKPENIIVTRDGRLKLTDFGIARMLDNQTMTVTGTLLGSPAYMAPEYIEGYPTDERADIFAFGAMLYFFATGRLPFEAPSPHALLKRIATCEYTPAQQARPAVHAGLSRLIERCLARLPESRIQTAALLGTAVDELCQGIGIDPKVELPQLLADAQAHGDGLGARLGPRYLDRGKKALAAGRQGAAIEDFDRVLSLTPEHAEVKKLLASLARRRAMGQGVRATLALVSAAVVAVFLGLGANRLYDNVAPRWTNDAVRDPREATLDAARAPRPPPADRNVTFILQGRGDLFVDGRLLVRGAEKSHAALLEPGRYEARLVGATRSHAVRFEVPKRGPIAPVLLDVRAVGAAGSNPAPGGATPPTSPAVQPTREVRFNAANVVTVYVDEATEPVVKERMGVFSLTLPHGARKLRFTNPSAYDNEMTLRVSETEPPQVVLVRMQPLQAKLYVRGAPAGAVVEVAGRSSLLNEATRDEPIFVPLPLGAGAQSYEVVVRAADGKRELWRARREFRPGQDETVEVKPNPL